ncbi:MAG: hypothetical protein WAT22_00085 [Saprospiraceae bacterium]|nr:hypothetical protein [Saprospiraceae bacterium]
MGVFANITKIKDFSGHRSAIYSMKYDHQKQVLYSAGGDGWIVKWHPLSDNPDGILTRNTTSKIFSLALNESKSLLVAGDMDGHLFWLDSAENKIIKRSAFHKGSILDLVFANDDILYSVSNDGYLCRWNVNEMVPELSLRLSTQGLRCIKYDQARDLLYIGASDNNIYVVDIYNFKIQHVITQAHGNSVFCIEMLDNLTMISGGRDAVCHLWDVTEYSKKETLDAHWFTINKIVAIPELSAFATASRDKTWRLWSTDDFELLKSIDVQKGGHINSVNALVWIPEAGLMVSAGDDRLIRMFKVELATHKDGIAPS